MILFLLGLQHLSFFPFKNQNVFVCAQNVEQQQPTTEAAAIMEEFYANLPMELQIKVQRAPPDKIIVNEYVVRFNATRVQEVRTSFVALMELQNSVNLTTEVNLTKAWSDVKCAKFQFLIDEFATSTTDDDNSTSSNSSSSNTSLAAVERKLEILRILIESDIVEVVEEVRAFFLFFPPLYGGDCISMSVPP